MNLTMPTNQKNFQRLTIKTNLYVYFSHGVPIALITPVDRLIAKGFEKKRDTDDHLAHIRRQHNELQEVPLSKIIKVANYFL